MDENRGQIDEIKAKLDIVSVVNQYVPSLKRSGRNYFGLCPFHKEKSPSFSVNPEIGLFKCFGCGVGGDVIKFIQTIEGIEFGKALEISAQRAGVILKKTYSKENDAFKQEKSKLLEANKLAVKLYHYLLLEHQSADLGRQYIQKRKIQAEQQKDFLLGFAPRSYEILKDFLHKKDHNNDQQLAKWGLLVEKNGRIYDKFRDRIMFPILDHYGDVVGFSGRKISEENLGPKYLNSPETIVYRKSNLLFGLFQAKETIRHEGFVIVVEGNVDIISSHGAGVKNIVAPLGTALTIDQLKLIKRYCDKVYFAFDNDGAGQKALLRSYELALEVGLDSFVVDIGDYKDVDEMIVKGGDWKGIVANPIDAGTYLIDLWAKKYELSVPTEKTKYIKAMFAIINKIPDQITRNEYLLKLSQKTSTPFELLTISISGYVDDKKTIHTSTEKAVEEVAKDPEKINSDQSSNKQPNLLIEFLALLYHNVQHKFDEKLLKQVIITPRARKLARILNIEQINTILDLEQVDYNEAIKDEFLLDIANEIKLNPTYQIDDDVAFASTLTKLARRIAMLQIKKKIAQLKQTVDDSDDNLKELVAEAKKLKS